MLVRPDGRHLAAALLALGLALAAIFVATGSPPPMSDDAWFKGPAAELASTGRLAAPGITGFFPRVHEFWACYPPLPQLLLAAFYAAFGISLRTSIGFAMLVHVGSAVGIGLVSWRILRGLQVAERAAWVAALLTGAVWLAGERLLDRPEELGLLFLWLDLALGAPRTAARAALSGVLAGLAALCAPWAGLLAAVTLVGRVWALNPGVREGAVSVAAGAVAAVVVFGGWIAVIELRHPGIFAEQFLGAMGWATVFEPYPQGVGAFLAAMLRGLGAQPWLLPSAMVAALWFPMVLREQAGDAEWRRLALVLYAGALGSLVLGFWTRPLAYTYTWGSLELLMPCLSAVIARFLTDAQSPLLGRGVVTALVALAWLGPARTLGWAARDDPDARPDGAFAALHALIPPGEPVAVTTRHWMAFQGRNPWRDAIFLSKRDPALLDDCRWLVLLAGEGADRPAFIDQFELVGEQGSEAPASLTYAWSVWRRRATTRN